MSTHSVSAMTGLKAPKRRAKGGAKVVDAKVSDLSNALESGQAVLDATVRLANALRSTKSAPPVAVKASPKAAPASKVSHPVARPSRPSGSKGVVSGRGWNRPKITDAPQTWQGTGDTVDD